MHTTSVWVAICAITVVLTSSGRHGTGVKMSFGGTRREHACLDALHDSVQPLNLLLGRQIVVLRLCGVRVESLVRHVRNLRCAECGICQVVVEAGVKLGVAANVVVSAL